MEYLALKHYLVEVTGLEEYQIHTFLLDYFECPDTYSYPKTVNSDDVRKIKHLARKLKSGMPCAYVLGKTFFFDRYFYVKKGVLIPRFDTEILVEQALKEISSTASDMSILDLCTGSGIIGVTLLKNTKHTQVTLSDSSSRALSVAKRNIVSLCTKEEQKRIKAKSGDLFQKIKGEFDLIVSNPPYIPTSDLKNLDKSVIEYEPKLALDGLEDGLAFYREIITQAPNFLRDNGVLMFEVGINQAKSVVKYLEKDFKCITIVKDNHGVERVVTARKR